jgi:hypothetical protein
MGCVTGAAKPLIAEGTELRNWFSVCWIEPAEVPAAAVIAAAWVAWAAGLANRWCRGKRRHRRCRRRRTGIAVHRRGVLGPHLGILGFQLRNHRGVLTQYVWSAMPAPARRG